MQAGRPAVRVCTTVPIEFGRPQDSFFRERPFTFRASSIPPPRAPFRVPFLSRNPMKASTRLPFLMASVLACSLAAAQLSGTYSANTNLAIPPSGSGGGPGGCTTGSPNTTEFTLNVPDAFVLSHLRLELTLTHTYVGDLTLTLKHCGTSVILYDRNPGSSSDLNGTYAFDDQALLSFASYVTTPTLVPPNTYLPVGSFLPLFGMSTAGDWTISI